MGGLAAGGELHSPSGGYGACAYVQFYERIRILAESHASYLILGRLRSCSYYLILRNPLSGGLDVTIKIGYRLMSYITTM